MQVVYVIQERDLDDNVETVIGVASTTERAKEMIREYYGEHKIISFEDIRDSGMEFAIRLEVMDHMNRPYEVDVWVNSFEVDEKMG